jgi:23S rRNA pseudouridine955/2504/2580 synthase
MSSTPKPAAAVPVQTVTVEAEEADRRLDNFLLGRLKGVPRARIYRIIRSGEVRINSRRAAPADRLQTGDRVRIPPVRMAQTELPALRHDQIAWLGERILLEDEDLLVLDKPAGLAVHGGSGISLGAIELLRAVRPGCDGMGLAHRLDRETSGCLLVAKRHSILRRLQAQFREGAVEKIYQALLVGALNKDEILADAPLLTTERRGGERIVRVDPSGKTAATRFVVERRFNGFTLVRIGLETGRTHQIRVHAAHLGHPVAGDERYGGGGEVICGPIALRRLFLHAASLAFRHPRQDREIRLASPLPDELRAVLARLARAPR